MAGLTTGVLDGGIGSESVELESIGPTEVFKSNACTILDNAAGKRR